MRSKAEGILFSDGPLSDQLAATTKAMMAAIEGYDGNALLNTSPGDLTEYFVQRFALDAPVLVDTITLDHQESKIDVRGSWDRDMEHAEGPVYSDSTEFIYHVPMAGDLGLLRLQPSILMRHSVRAHVVPGKVFFTYNSETPSPTEIQKAFQDDLAWFCQVIERTSYEMALHTAYLRSEAKRMIEKRRQRLLHAQRTAVVIGIPLTHRSDSPRTYAVPEIRRKPVPAPPRASSAPYVAEPAIEMAEYQYILGVIGNMVTVMERSPTAFTGMVEEDLRTHFLVQLNGHYEGRATGETFSGSGSTDILLLEKGRSVFIAEYKYWKGAESLTSAIDQLLDYATWRDAKVAILIFNRNKVFSDVVAQIRPTAMAHPLVKREGDPWGETGFGFVIGQRDDSNREMILTILAFDVPTNRATSGRLKGGKPK